MGRGFKITLIIILSIIAVALIGILTLLLVRGTKFNFKFNMKFSDKLIEEKEIVDLKDLKIDTNVADIDIETSDDEKVTVKLYCDECEENKITENENEIFVVLKDKKKTFRLFSKGPRIIVTVPKTYNKNIGIKGDVADVDMAPLKDATLNLELTTGDLDASDLDKANIKVTTGDVDIDNINDLVCKATTGDIKARSVNNHLEISVVTGDIKIERVNLNENSLIKTNTGDVKIEYTNNIYIEGKTNIGKARINTNDRKSDIVLSIESNVGDIKVG